MVDVLDHGFPLFNQVADLDEALDHRLEPLRRVVLRLFEAKRLCTTPKGGTTKGKKEAFLAVVATSPGSPGATTGAGLGALGDAKAACIFRQFVRDLLLFGTSPPCSACRSWVLGSNMTPKKDPEL